jgi:hypothetical protein
MKFNEQKPDELERPMNSYNLLEQPLSSAAQQLASKALPIPDMYSNI